MRTARLVARQPVRHSNYYPKLPIDMIHFKRSIWAGIPAALILALGLAAAMPSGAHSFKAGDVVVDHPYATPTVAGARTGAVYFRGLKNSSSTQADRLVSRHS